MVLGAWETVWICLAVTLLAFVIDAGMASRLARRNDSTRLAKKASRQQSMTFKDLEEK